MPLAENRANNRAKSLANLKPFKPGQSGNPGGRPKKKPITRALEQLFASETLASEREAMAIAKHLSKLARGKVKFCNGAPAVAAAKFIADRIEGTVAQKIEGTGKDGAITVEVTGEEARARIAELTERVRNRTAQRG